jgi:hypothetical protein
MTPSTEQLLATLERLPEVWLDIDTAQRSGGVRVDGQLVACIDLEHDRVLVNAPADVIPTLDAVFPSSSPTADGIVFDLVDPRSSSEALAAIRRRARVQRFVWQLQSASP